MAEANPDGLFGIPGGAEVWANDVDGYWYVVYRVPGTNTPMAWRIENNDDVAAIFGPGNDWRVARHFRMGGELYTPSFENEDGVVMFGSSRQLANLSEHPFDAFNANFEAEARVRPWLRDPEVLALTAKAVLEGRQVTDGELAGTSWWKNSNEAQRQWASLNARDPGQANVVVRDAQTQIRTTLARLGAGESIPEPFVKYLSERLVSGEWSSTYLNGQIAELLDPYAPGELDPQFKMALDFIGGSPVASLANNTGKVEEIVRTWLGPAHAAGWSRGELERWAGRLRNDPTAEEDLVNVLKDQRVALLPEYTDRNLSYEAIAGPVRGVVRQAWGQDMDEKDPLFHELLRVGGRVTQGEAQGGLAGQQQLLLKEGLNREVGHVVNGALASVGAAFGGTQRRPT